MPKVSELDSYDALVDAAELLFAEQGFRATTIKQIAEKSGVNSAMVYYHFGDKRMLYLTMLRRRFSDMTHTLSLRVPPGPARHAPPEDAIRQFVRFQVEYLTAHPHLPRLLVRELVDHEAKHASDFIPELVAKTFGRLCDVIRLGQQQGRFRADIEPRFAAIHTVGMVAYAFIARPAIRRVLDVEGTTIPPELITAYGEHAADFAVAALAVRPATPEGR